MADEPTVPFEPRLDGTQLPPTLGFETVPTDDRLDKEISKSGGKLAKFGVYVEFIHRRGWVVATVDRIQTTPQAGSLDYWNSRLEQN